MAVFATLALAFAPAVDADGSPAEDGDPPWRLVATDPETGCAIVRRQTEVRRLCSGDALDVDVGIVLVAAEPARARFRADAVATAPLDLVVALGAAIDLAALRRVQDAAAPQPRWVTDDARIADPDQGPDR